MSVLVVDDNIVLLQNIARSFAWAGRDVECAICLAQAREILQAVPIDVICLDLQLADGHGLDFLEEIRRIDPGLPVIIMSASHTPENRKRSTQLGAVAFLPKPFALSKLQALVETIDMNTRSDERAGDTDPGSASIPTRLMEV